MKNYDRYDLGILEDYSGPDNPVTQTIYATQGGGTVIRAGDRFEFLDPPAWGEYNIGDLMPEGWGVTPIGDVPVVEEPEPLLEPIEEPEGSWYE